MEKIKSVFLAMAATGVLAASVHAATITQWNFNSTTNDASTSTGVTTPSTGSGTLTLVGGTTNTFAGGSPGDTNTTDNSGLNSTTYPAQGTGSGTAGVEYAVSTAGDTNISVSLDFRQSGTASRYFQLLVSSDGSTFGAPSGGSTSIGTINTGNTLTTFDANGLYTNNSGGGSQTYVQGITYAFAPGSIYENNPNFAFEWVAVTDPNGGTDGNGSNYVSSNAGTTAAYTSAGTARFDLVTVSGTPAPEPASLGLLGLGAAALLTRRRK